MALLPVVVLNSIIPKFNEPFTGRIRNWYSDGYQSGAPGTNMCVSDSDCQGGLVCLSGYCAGIPLRYNKHGMFIGEEYRNFASNPNPLNFIDWNPSGIMFSSADGRIRVELDDEHARHKDYKNYTYDYTH